MKKKQIEEIFQRFQNNHPTPKIELDYETPYMLVVAVVLSAQSTDKMVNKVTQNLFKVACTPQKMLQLGIDGLKDFIKVIGLFNSKAKHIIELSHMLIEKFDCIVPDNLESLQQLPGVGRKSANVILNSIFNKPTIAVDTHVFRTSNRIGLCNTKNVLHTEIALLDIVPNKFKQYAHHWLVLHGRYICKARKPKCKECIISDICLYEKKS